MFPIFELNDSYIKAIGNIFSANVKQIYMLKKQALDIIDKAIEQNNIRVNTIMELKQSVLRSDIDDRTCSEMFLKELPPTQSTKSKQQSLTIDQRLLAQEKLEDLKKLKKSKYKTNLKAFEEYHIPIPNSDNLHVSKYHFKIFPI